MTATMRWSARLPTWDPTLPALGQLLARGAVTATATRWRRYTVFPFYLNAIVLAAALIFPAEAHAAFVGTSPLLHELGIKDSYGVDIGNYAISTDYGTVLDGGSKAVLGTILDAGSIMLIMVPLAIPALASFNLDLTWFGVVTVIAVEIGLLTPPLGLAVFVIHNTLGDSRIGVNDIFAGALPFAIVMLLTLILIVLVPWFALTLT